MLKSLNNIKFREILVEDTNDDEILEFINYCGLHCRVLFWRNSDGNFIANNTYFYSVNEMNKFLFTHRKFLITKSNAFSITRAIDVTSMPFDEIIKRYSYTY